MTAEAPGPVLFLGRDGRVEKASGTLRHVAVGTPLAELADAEGLPALASAFDSVVAEGRARVMEVALAAAAGGGPAWFLATLTPVKDAGRVTGVLFVAVDVTKRREEEERLRRSERLMVDTQGTAHLGTWEWDPREKYARWSEELYRIYGLDPAKHAPSYEDYLTRVHPDDRERVRTATEGVFRDQRPYSHDERIFRPNGGMRYLHTWAQAVAAPDGSLERLIGVCQDITERKIAEEEVVRRLHEKEILLKEIHHRVKNNLQVIASLMSLQSRRIPDPESRAAFNESRSRVRAMALVHEGLYRSEDLSSINLAEYARDLGRDLAKAYATDSVAVVVDAEPLTVDVETAVQGGLVLHELVANALKHAFPSERNGEVHVRLTESPSGAIEIEVVDNGVGLPADFKIASSKGFGLHIVRTIVEQFGGSLATSAAAGGGSAFRVVLPRKE